VRLTLTIGLEAVVMGYIISREAGRALNSLGSIILGILVAAPLILNFLAPNNGVGGAGKRFRPHLLCAYSLGPFPQVTHFGPPIANTIN
jgi:hypothetical protein